MINTMIRAAQTVLINKPEKAGLTLKAAERRASMDHDRIAQVLEDYKQGRVELQQALNELRHLPFEDLGYAKIDHHRVLRQGHPEVIFAEDKSVEQLEGIIDALAEGLQHTGHASERG
jgi:hypothetical protein